MLRKPRRKNPKEDREKREKYEKNLKKAEEHIAAKRHKEAVDALTEARKYAKPDDLKTIDERLDEQKKLVGQGDLFAMMEEPEQAQPQQSQVQQPTQQPATAQVQPQPRPEPVKPVQQPTVQQQAAPQHQSAMPQQEMPAQAAHPAQQPYGNPGQDMVVSTDIRNSRRDGAAGATQRRLSSISASQWRDGAAKRRAAWLVSSQRQPRYARQPMPFDHDMAAHAPRMADPDDAPPYRPEEYAEHPDFPASMLQKK